MAFLTWPADHPARFYLGQGTLVVISSILAILKSTGTINPAKSWKYLAPIITLTTVVLILEVWKRRADFLDKKKKEEDKEAYKSKVEALEERIVEADENVEKADLKVELMAQLLNSSNQIVNGKASRFSGCKPVTGKDTFLQVTRPKTQIQMIAEEMSRWLESFVAGRSQFKIAVALFRNDKMTGYLAFTHGSAESPSLKNPQYFSKSFFVTTFRAGKKNAANVIISDIAAENAEARAKKKEPPYFETPGVSAEGSIVGFPIQIVGKGIVLVLTIKSAPGIITKEFVKGNGFVIDFYKTRISMESCLVWLRRSKLDDLGWDDLKQLEEEYV